MALRERAPLPRIEPFVELFAKRERPHMGADLDTARKFVGMIWGVSAALTIAFLAMAPPTDQSGVAGWPTAVPAPARGCPCGTPTHRFSRTGGTSGSPALGGTSGLPPAAAPDPP